MRITIFGSGYVGLVTGACLADAGNDVVCVDVDERKIAMLKQGEVPIHEPGLDAVVKRNFEAGRLHFTTDAKEGSSTACSNSSRWAPHRMRTAPRT
jgi:UDPglucose 6-dehydrogenase